MVNKLLITKYQILGNPLLIVNHFPFLILMASSSSSKRRRSYDVFLSFRGTDVRNNFLGHLYTALDQRGINTYMDSEELRKGEQISPALMEAIKESRIAIVVFSENYVSSAWCLEELAKIMECKEQRELMVFPVFYKVEPCEVRTPRKSYLEAMAKHEDKFGKDSEKVTRWKKTLFEAGSLSGQHFTDGYEAGFIQHVVQEISTQLDRMPLDVAKYPVGIDSRVQELKTILNLESKDDVLMVGLWGQGGVGKTTLGKAIYNVVFRGFQGSSFLEHVRENSKNSNDLVSLQEKLLAEVLMGKKLTVFNVGGGSRLIQERLCNKKVLIILDDVDDKRQLNALAGDCEWFPKGSRIIITTRDKHLLTYHGVDHIYEVKALDDGEAFELFRKHAFPRNRKIEIRRDLIDSVLHYAGGLPLALEVLGSMLRDRREQERESILRQFAQSPPKEINDVLKVSYYGLEDNEREIFLDIACFFKGWGTRNIEKILDSCGFESTSGIKFLIERSLIREEHGILQMHDLIQSMGKDIVLEECRDDPGKRSRLWLEEDVFNVLSRDKGTKAAKAIVLKLPKPKKTYISPKAFKKMMKFRLLILVNVDNSSCGPIHLPNTLKWLRWHNCPSFPEFSDGPKELVGLDMQNSNIQVGLEQFKGFKKLKFINFNESQSLVSMPVLDCTLNLEELDLHGCKNLEHLPNVSKTLQLLNLQDCSKLQRFPNTPDKIKFLQEVNLRGTSIEELPASIENLVSLEDIDLRDCKKLAILPSSIYRLQNLGVLRLGGCSKLIKFPKEEEDSSDPYTKTGFRKLRYFDLANCNLLEVEFLENHSCFPSLGSLDLSGNNFTDLPTCEQLHELRWLHVSHCKGLKEILNIPGQLTNLGANGCESLSKIPSGICDVKYVDFYSCHELVRNVLTIHDLFKLERFCTKSSSTVVLPGGEMPEWLVPNNEGYISFMASKVLFEKFLALAVCVVFRVKERPEDVMFWYHSSVDSKSSSGLGRRFQSSSDHVWLRCIIPWEISEINALSPNDWSPFRCIITTSGGAIVKKCGFRLICKPLENHLKVLLQHNPSLDPALLYEVQHDHSQTSAAQENSNATEDLLDRKTSTEENSSSKLVLEGLNMANFSLQRWMEHEDNQTNIEDGNSNETKDLQGDQTSTEEDSSINLVRKGLDMANFLVEKYRYSLIHGYYRNVRPGGEMPEEFILVEDNTISFMASQDLYDKFLGLALCVVLSVEDGKKEISFNIVPHVNGQRRNVLSRILGSFDSDHMWLQYLESNVLWGLLEGGIDFDQFDERYLRFSLRLKISGGIVKKLGYMIRCRPLEDDLKVVLEDNQLVNSASLCEDSHDPVSLYEKDSDKSKYSETDSFIRRRRLQREFRRLKTEFLRKCHILTEELETEQTESWIAWSRLL